MGKRLIQQARGKGGPRYRAPSFRYKGRSSNVRMTKDIVEGKIVDLIKCRGHSSPLMSIAYDKENVLVPAPEGVKVGDSVYSGDEVELSPGNTMILKNIPEGTLIYNIEKSPGDGGQFCRAGGSFARVFSHHKDKVIVLLPSKKKRHFYANCRASIGVIAGGGRTDKPILKAGNNHHRKKAKNKLYPRVSGLAMNAVDHPHGGSLSSHKGRPTVARRFAPPGAKVGKVRPRRVGRKKGKQ